MPGTQGCMPGRNPLNLVLNGSQAGTFRPGPPAGLRGFRRHKTLVGHKSVHKARAQRPGGRNDGRFGLSSDVSAILAVGRLKGGLHRPASVQRGENPRNHGKIPRTDML